MKILFVNADAAKPQCAIYQAGLLYADALRFCESFDLTYYEASSGKAEYLPDPTGYDAVIFNYQHVSMSIMPPEYFSYCRKAIGFLYEARLKPEQSPMHFGDQTCGQLFDILMVPDPTMKPCRKREDKKWSVPRVVPRFPDHRNNNHPVWVGTFGFPSPWKALDDIVRMMNDEYPEAVFRLNFAPASHQDGTGLQEMMESFANDLRGIAKPGIEIRFSQEYMDQDRLIKWLAQNSVNVFLAKEQRSIETGGALLASTDMAIAARKPIMVSPTLEARHLSQLCYPSLKDAERGQGTIVGNGDVDRLYESWTPQNFAARVDELVRGHL